MEFSKPFQSIEQQLEILSERGVIIDCNAEHYLRHINYYRLAGYSLPFQKDCKTHAFYPNTKFSDILNLYIFDREFRLLLLDAIERIEVSVRANWSYCFAKNYGPLAYIDPKSSNNSHQHAENMLRLKQECQRSYEAFIMHFRNNNIDPPVWAACEVMSLGLLSKWLKSMKSPKCRNEMEECYGLDYSVLASFIEHLSYLRNLCAHHSRVWNKKMTKIMQIPKSKPVGLVKNFNFNAVATRKIYNTLIMIIYFLGLICPENHFKHRLVGLLDIHAIDPVQMGFPGDWYVYSVWE